MIWCVRCLVFVEAIVGCQEFEYFVVYTPFHYFSHCTYQAYWSIIAHIVCRAFFVEWNDISFFPGGREGARFDGEILANVGAISFAVCFNTWVLMLSGPFAESKIKIQTCNRINHPLHLLASSDNSRQPQPPYPPPLGPNP